MKFLFRLLWIVFTANRRSSCDVLGPVDTPMRVWINDLDVFMHINNGVYLTLMDLARTDMLLRSGQFHRIRKHGWYPVVAAESIRFKKSLKLGQRYYIRTRVVGWSDKAVYLQQSFVRNNELIAEAIVDARFLSRKGGAVSTKDLLEFIGHTEPSPALPEWLTHWLASVDGLYDSGLSALSSEREPT